jgi:very-short-patch-repair endonuclease
MQGVKFRRQHPIAPYTVDFYCDVAKLVIELDGAQHEVRNDRRRTEYLERQGLRVIRFDNIDVVQHRDAVLQAIWDAVAPFAPHPNPSPPRRGARAGGRWILKKNPHKKG